MVDAGARDVADAPPGGPDPLLPLLLVAAELERRVEAPDALDRTAAKRQVRAPDEIGVAVLRSEVERGDRERLPPAAMQAGALEPRPDRATEHLVLRERVGGREQRLEPRRPDLHVVVQEAQELRRRRVDRRVPRGVEPPRLAVGDIPGSVSSGEPLRRGIGRVVLDDDHLGAVRGRLRGDGREGDSKVVAPAPRREQDRG